MLIKDHWLYSLVLWAGCAVGHWRKHCIISGYKFIMQSPVLHTPESSFFIRYDFLCATWKDECTEVSHTYMHPSVWCLGVSLAALAVTLWASRVENEKRLQTKSCIYSIGVWPFEGVLFESLAGILCSTNSRWNTSTGVKWKKECTNNDSAYDHGYHRFINLHLRCKLKGTFGVSGLILIQIAISIKNCPSRLKHIVPYLSIAPFKNLLDHHAAVEWEGILKRSYYLKFEALWMKWEPIYSPTAGFLTMKRERERENGRNHL